VSTPTKAGPLEIQLGTAELPSVDQPGARLGSTVEVEDLATGAELTYRLVNAHDAAPKDGRLSVASPVGAALRGRGVGDVVTATTPRGQRCLRIHSIR
jgi:transcription elongation factor GreA